MWYKKEGEAVLKAIDIERIQSVSLICSNRPLVYLLPPKHSMVLQSEAGNNNKDTLLIQPLEHEDNASGKQNGVDFYIFRIVQTDGKDHVLRSAKIDRVMKWINLISLVKKICICFFHFLQFLLLS
jgi:hypothetical protein